MGDLVEFQGKKETVIDTDIETIIAAVRARIKKQHQEELKAEDDRRKAVERILVYLGYQPDDEGRYHVVKEDALQLGALAFESWIIGEPLTPDIIHMMMEKVARDFGMPPLVKQPQDPK